MLHIMACSFIHKKSGEYWTQIFTGNLKDIHEHEGFKFRT